jgi:hypothetical protein
VINVRSLEDLLGCTVSTADGAAGRLSDVYYDDRTWTVRYLVVDDIEEGSRARLVSPFLVDRVGDQPPKIDLSLDLDRLLEAPDIGQEKPVSLQAERDYFDYFGWPYYWQGAYGAGIGALPIVAPLPVMPPPDERGREADRASDSESVGATAGQPSEASHHLRSALETNGYHVQALDGEIGHVEDFLVDEVSWGILAVVVDTSNWWFGKKVALPAGEFTRVEWQSRLVFVDETREQVQQTREFDRTTLQRDV